jgi:hypothetical protein
MKIELKYITIQELTNGYKDSQDAGVIAYGGKLDVRPPFQREFVYKGNQRDAVIETALKNYPLNVMYWACREDGTYEIIDGQQRTISICQYVCGDFSHNGLYFHSLTKEQQEQLLNYKLMVYFCSGTEKEKLEWFKVVNIAGEKLTAQELRNSVYCGTWLSDAKKYFSKNGCYASNIGKDYLKGTADRQDYLETAIKWVCNSSEENDICSYMSKHQHDKNAETLKDYFTNIIEWVQSVFVQYRKEMKGIEWGFFYNKYKDTQYNPKEIEAEVKQLMQDEDVENKKGIYEYIFTGDAKFLELRAFDDNTKREIFEQQDGICVKCEKQFTIDNMEADHIEPWSKGGKTEKENCQLLCKPCNRIKSNK